MYAPQGLPAVYFSVLASSVIIVAARSGLLPPCVMLPAVYKFGMEKGRIVYYSCIGAACAIPFALPSNALDGGMSTASVFLLPVIAAALFAVSWAISTAVYGKKSL